MQHGAVHHVLRILIQRSQRVLYLLSVSVTLVMKDLMEDPAQVILLSDKLKKNAKKYIHQVN